MVRRSVTALASAGLLAILGGFSVTSAQNAPAKPSEQAAPGAASTPQNATPPIEEHHFVVQAALSNMAEVQLGHLATKKAQHAEVRKFAQTMIDDHLQAQKELAEAAYGAGIKWPTQLNDSDRQLRQRLSSVGDREFDREYLKAVVDAHRTAEGLLSARSAAASEGAALGAKVNTWAAKTLPRVRAHLQEAERVSGEIDKGK